VGGEGVSEKVAARRKHKLVRVKLLATRHNCHVAHETLGKQVFHPHQHGIAVPCKSYATVLQSM